MNTLFAKIYAAVRARGALTGWSDQQNAARHVVKLQEELAEVAEAFVLPGAIATSLRRSGDCGTLIAIAGDAARAVNGQSTWNGCGLIDIARAKAELVDVYIVLVCLKTTIERITGDPFDIEAEALDKSHRDIIRRIG